MNPFNLAFYFTDIKQSFFLFFTNLRSLFNFLSICGGVEVQVAYLGTCCSVYSTTLVEGVEVSIERRENFSKKRKCRT